MGEPAMIWPDGTSNVRPASTQGSQKLHVGFPHVIHAPIEKHVWEQSARCLACHAAEISRIEFRRAILRLGTSLHLVKRGGDMGIRGKIH